MTAEIQSIKTAYIATCGKRRAVTEEKVAALAGSIKDIGLRTPITVRFVDGWVDPDGAVVDGQPVLVAGAHRLAAVKLLGWDQIDCYVFEGDSEIDARLWEIAENLCRAELTKLEEAEQIAEWVRLTEQKQQMERERQVAQLAPAVLQDGRRKGPQHNEGGIRAATRELKAGGNSISRRKAERAIKISESITPEAKKAAVDAGLDNNQSALLRVVSADDQVGEVKKIVAEKIGTLLASTPKSDRAMRIYLNHLRKLTHQECAAEITAAMDYLGIAPRVYGILKARYGLGANSDKQVNA